MRRSERDSPRSSQSLCRMTKEQGDPCTQREASEETPQKPFLSLLQGHIEQIVGFIHLLKIYECLVQSLANSRHLRNTCLKEFLIFKNTY